MGRLSNSNDEPVLAVLPSGARWVPKHDGIDVDDDELSAAYPTGGHSGLSVRLSSSADDEQSSDKPKAPRAKKES